MLYLVKLRDVITDDMLGYIDNNIGKVTFISSLMPLVMVETDDKKKFYNTDFIEKVEEDEIGELKNIHVVPPIDFSIITPFRKMPSNVTVAIIDGGIDNDKNEYNIISKVDYTGTGHENNGIKHATAVANIICNVAPRVKILSAKITDDMNFKTSDLLRALEWAYRNKADIINMSLGVQGKNGIRNRCKGDCLICQFVSALSNVGILSIAAAGNEGPGNGTIGCPGNCPDAITVGAININRNVAEFSSRGRIGQHKPDIVTSGYIFDDKRKDKLVSGTSFAAPIITGICAAIHHRYANISELKDVILLSTVDIAGEECDRGKGLFSLNKLVDILRRGA